MSKAGSIAWNSSVTGEYKFIHPLENASQRMKAALDDKAYIDAHAWCFVPHSFRLLIHDLFCLGFIPFQEVGFFNTEGCEFFVALGRDGKGIDKSRLEILDIVDSEIKNSEPVREVPKPSISMRKNVIRSLIKRFTRLPFYCPPQ